MNDEAWRIWNRWPEYGEVLRARATGDEAEMECSKALCRVLDPIYRPGMSVLDVGCGAGHYLTSLRSRLDPEIDYRGMDLTPHYIELARQSFPPGDRFSVGDVREIPWPDDAFDIVVCSNVLLNVPPPPAPALRELVRVSRGRVVIRTVVGRRNYIVKELHFPGEGDEASRRESDLLDADGEAVSFHYVNIYTERYLREVIEEIDDRIEVSVIDDVYWESFDNEETLNAIATRVVDGRQISGNLIFDWKFLILSVPR